MNQNPTEVIEWHIFESPGGNSSPVEPQTIHMGPFFTEESCRAVLASLQQIPCFHHGTLEVHKKPQAAGEADPNQAGGAGVSIVGRRKSSGRRTRWTSPALGARLTDPGEPPRLGEFLEVRYGQREAVFRVVWVGLPGTPPPVAIWRGIPKSARPTFGIWTSRPEPMMSLCSRKSRSPAPSSANSCLAISPRLRTLDYSGKCIQARTVGGDYYDFLELGPGRVGFVLADVAGKGVAAALLMANLQGSIHNRRDIETQDLPDLLVAVNDHLFQHTDADRYATLFFGCYDDEARSLAYVNCGHSPPLLLRRTGAVDRLSATATVLGLFAKWECSMAETHIEPGDVLSIFTDGITETTAANGEEFGEDRLLRVLEDSRELEAGTILSNVEHAVDQFRSSEHLQDDLTLVVARAQ